MRLAIVAVLALALPAASHASIIDFTAPPSGTAHAVALVRSNSVNLIGQLAVAGTRWDIGAMDAYDPLGGGTYGFLATYTTPTGDTGIAMAVNEYEAADLLEGFPKPTTEEAFGCTTAELVAELNAFDHNAIWSRWVNYAPAMIPYGQVGTVIYLGSNAPDGAFSSSFVLPDPPSLATGLLSLLLIRPVRRELGPEKDG